MQCSNELSKSAMLMKFIGVPGVCEPDFSQLTNENFPVFFNCAKKNKVPLFFLRTVASQFGDCSFRDILSIHENKHQATLDFINFVSDTLENIGVPYTFFKTLKPFPYLPSDVDVLVLSDEDFKTVVRALNHEDCRVLDRDAYGATMFSPAHNMSIDLTTNVAVSGMVYMDKVLLFDHVTEMEFGGRVVRTLESPVNLLTVAAHSLFKEQMYTLSDYYTLVLLVQHWEEALKLAEKFHLKHALETVMQMTSAITLNVFGSSNPLIKRFNVLRILPSALDDNKLRLPIKYDLPTLMVDFLKKLATDSVTIKSMSSLARSFCNPSFYGKVLNHVTRKKY